MFDFSGKTAVVTGAGGAIGGDVALGLARAGAGVAIWDLLADAAEQKAETIRQETSANVIAVVCDATSKPNVEEATAKTVAHFGTIDMLVNGAGGSHESTTTSSKLTFFDIKPDDTQRVIDLNYLTAVIPSQVVGRLFAEKGGGAIVNITSVGGELPLSRALAYSNGKAAADSFTRWLAVHMATTYAPEIRVNAVAPGFMITDQNRFLLVDEQTGELTERGETILKNVPSGRFGNPDEVVGGVLWLLSEQASFVNGAIVPIDGGFTAFAGV